jgi:hypothetical protein
MTIIKMLLVLLRPFLRDARVVLGHRRIVGNLGGVDGSLGDQLSLPELLLSAEIPLPVRHGHLGLGASSPDCAWSGQYVGFNVEPGGLRVDALEFLAARGIPDRPPDWDVVSRDLGGVLLERGVSVRLTGRRPSPDVGPRTKVYPQARAESV